MNISIAYSSFAALSITLLVAIQLDWRIGPFIGAFAAFSVLWFSCRAHSEKRTTTDILWAVYALLTSACFSLITTTAWSQSNYPGTLAIFLLALIFSASSYFTLSYPNWHVSERSARPSKALRYLTTIILQIIALRCLAAGSVELLTEEAYYWKYGENLALSYLDHPPLVALCARAGQFLFGVNEFGVRALGLFCSVGSFFFLYHFGKEALGITRRLSILTFLFLLPFPLSAGFFMTPDTPLLFCWCGTIYFLHRVLSHQSCYSWIGVGVFLGLAMLSKYPAILLGAGIPLYLILDRTNRHWFLHPMPYIAALIVLVLFSPVIFWNYDHSWASFAFQSTRRFSAKSEFSTHLWLTFLLLSFTPVGIYSVVTAFKNRKDIVELSSIGNHLLFCTIFSLVPLVLFGYASFTQEIKVNWLGPATLVWIPLFALTLQPSSPRLSFLRGWVITGVILSVSLHSLMLILSSGLPGLGVPRAFRKFTGWSQLAEKIDTYRVKIEQSTSVHTIIAGADSHYVSSEIDFYLKKRSTKSGMMSSPTEGRILINKEALMYRYWSSPDQHLGNNILFVSRTENDVADDQLQPYFKALGEVERIEITRENKVFAVFFARVGFGYHPPH